MTAPFKTGDLVVWLSLDAQGMRVERTPVVDVRPDGDGWLVKTPAGTEHVDERGEGKQLVPLEPETIAEFDSRGDTFVVRSTHEQARQDRQRREHEARRHSYDLEHRRNHRDPGRGR
jgi:hypothetical protein